MDECNFTWGYKVSEQRAQDEKSKAQEANGAKKNA